MDTREKLETLGGGALETALTFGRRPGVSLEYHGLLDLDGDVGDLALAESL